MDSQSTSKSKVLVLFPVVLFLRYQEEIGFMALEAPQKCIKQKLNSTVSF